MNNYPKPPRINPALMAQARTEAQDKADEILRNTMAVIDTVGTNPHVARREFAALMGAPKGR